MSQLYCVLIVAVVALGLVDLARRHRALDLPADALPGYRSEHGELYWEIDVKSDEMGPDTHLRRRTEIVPVTVPEEEDVFAGGFGDDEG